MNEQESKKEGKVVIISGPSGVGKSTICKEVVKRLNNVYLSVSITTRPKSEAEVDGRDYRFVSEQEFKRCVDDGLLLEYAEVFGHLYGTPKDKVDEALKAGKIIILEIDVAGGKQAKAVYRDAVMIFILPPTQKELAERINHRGREYAETVEERLDEVSSEVAAAWQYYENMVINDDLEQAINEVIQIIQEPKTLQQSTGEKE